jgi:CheY-like chemotaxis protein
VETKKTVVCIEDEPEMIDLIKLIVERGGYEMIGALGGREGLDIVRKHRPDLVLLDLTMPGIDGWEVHRQLKGDDDLKDIPVIVVTALTRSAASARGPLNEVADYLTKPFAPHKLVGSIDKVLGAVAH